MFVCLVACAPGRGPDNGASDASTSGNGDAHGQTDANGQSDGGNGNGNGDGGGTHDANPDAFSGVITGGPCLSNAAGATAYRVRWVDAGNTAQVVYEVNGLPDHSRDHTAAYGYQIGFTPSFVDPFLGDGGLQLDSSDFVDIELTTAGVSNIASATLSIYGRSYNTTTSGSFNWQTFHGTGSSPTDFVSNVAPYQWYSAPMTTELAPNDNTTLVRIKAGPNSDSLVVHRIEICLQAT